MRTWIGLFRGVNVGGHQRLPMKELAALLAGSGCQQVKTYIQSGNVVFRAEGTAAALGERILVAVLNRFGFRPGLMLLTAAELARAAAANPYADACAQPATLHLWFLTGVPTAAAVRSLAAVRAASERCARRGKVLYLHTPDGMGRSKLAARLEALLGVGATARNWRTVTQLLELARGDR